MNEIVFCLCLLIGAGTAWTLLQRKKKRRDVTSSADLKRTDKNSFNHLSAALILELAATMLRAGQPLAGVTGELAQLNSAGDDPSILQEVTRNLKHGLSWAQAWERAEEKLECRTPPSLLPLRHCLDSLADQGVPTAELLDIVAERHRRIEARQAEKQAAKLAVKLVVPLGLCSLPAFICWGIVPVMIALLPGLAGAL